MSVTYSREGFHLVRDFVVALLGFDARDEIHPWGKDLDAGSIHRLLHFNDRIRQLFLGDQTCSHKCRSQLLRRSTLDKDDAHR
jgi:hypothetical protein